MNYLGERQLREMDAEALRAHIRALQAELYTSTHTATVQHSAGKAAEASARDKMGQAYAELRETRLAASRDVSFYWRIVSKLGDALGFKGAAGTVGSVEDDWKSYARDLVQHAQAGANACP